ncbi:MAG: hypothetical protein AAF960_30060 [Bacteroidota bacterium]
MYSTTLCFIKNESIDLPINFAKVESALFFCRRDCESLRQQLLWMQLYDGCNDTLRLAKKQLKRVELTRKILLRVQIKVQTIKSQFLDKEVSKEKLAFVFQQIETEVEIFVEMYFRVKQQALPIIQCWVTATEADKPLMVA